MSATKPTAPSLSYKGAWLAGVDEVGRGPLAGDVVAAAVILDQRQPIEGLADSKKLTAARREKFFAQIMLRARCVAVGRASVAEIDQINILHASMLAMHRAVQGLATPPEHVLVDGNRLPDWPYSAQAIVKGDALFECISAASIIAKVTRDRELQALASRYPEYGFEKHKGYPTAQHLSALQKYGACEIHRQSFAPVRAVAKRSAVG